MSKLVISESEKKEILKKHNTPNYGDFVFECHMTLDGRFMIFRDEIFDLIENRYIGNFFDKIENIKYIIENVSLPEILERESVFLNQVKSVLKTNFIVESSFNMKKLKDVIIQKRAFGDYGDLIGESSPKTILYEQGILSLLGDAALSIARKVKEWLWSTSGMMIDAFLVASGIGKSVQWVPWAIAFVLDVYQWSSGDYGSDTEFKESSTFWKILTLGFEVLGMMSAGPVALAAKRLFGPVKALKTEGQISQWVSKNPQAKQVITNISNLIGGVSKKLSGLSQMFVKKFPKLSQWINGVISNVGRFTSSIAGFLSRILKPVGQALSAPGKIAQNVGKKIQTAAGTTKDIGAGLRSATNTGMLLGGIHLGSKGLESYAQKKEEEQIDKIINAADAVYTGLEP